MSVSESIRDILSSLKLSYMKLIKVTELAINQNLETDYINQLAVEYNIFLRKFTSAFNSLRLILSDTKTKKSIIKEINSIASNLQELSKQEIIIFDKLHKSREILSKYKYLKLIETTEKSLIQSSIQLSQSFNQPPNNNQFQRHFLYAYPSEHFEIKESSLYIGNKRCKEPIIKPHDIGQETYIQKGESVYIQYPISDSKDTTEEDISNNVFFKYMLFSVDDDSITTKVPSFCNGIKYESKGITINYDCVLKIVACARDMLDSSIVTIKYNIKSADNVYLPLDKPNFNPERDRVVFEGQGAMSKIKPPTLHDLDDTPSGTPGSFHTGSIYVMKKNSYLHDEDEF